MCQRIICQGCGGEHDGKASSGKGRSERRAAARRQGMRALGILAGLVAAIGMIACGQEQARQKAAQQEQARQEAARQELQASITVVLKGHGVPKAAAYDKDSLGPHRLVVVTRSGVPHAQASSLPPEWIAKTVSEMALVAVVEEEEIKLNTRCYSGGSPITRYRCDWWVEVRMAQTGVLLDCFTVKGETPGDFPVITSVNTIRIDGRVKPAQFVEALFEHLKLVRQYTGGPTGRRETNPIGMTFLEFGPGSFTMGSESSEARDSEKPLHRVTISRSFDLQTTEVTQGQWKAVMGSNPSVSKGDDLPVENVSWYDCQAFIRKLNQMDPGKGYRLPTEAEWEYACRAGTTGERNLDAIAWYSGNLSGNTHPVGRKQPNAWGLYDMLGNVEEWCSDWYGGYPSGSVTDPRGPSSGSYRVFRGGCWFEDAQFCRAAYRSYFIPEQGSIAQGFRLARGSAR